MDSRLGETHEDTYRTLDHRTHNGSELDFDPSTIQSTMESMDNGSDSDEPSIVFEGISAASPQAHLKGCAFKFTKTCSCDRVRKYQEYQKRQQSQVQSETANSTILAGNAGVVSPGSSESFYSAQSNFSDATPNVAGVSNELNVAVREIESSSSKQRDTNHNIDAAVAEDAGPEPPPHDGNSSDETSYMIPLPFLQKLSKEIDMTPPKTTEEFKELDRRLSKSFAQNPQEFRERLVTIIEEKSDMEKTIVSIHRLTNEFRKKCKFIDDISMPTTLMATITGTGDEPEETSEGIVENGEAQALRTPKTIFESAQKSNQSPLCISALKRANGTPRTPATSRTPQNISPFKDSFQFWENFCEKNTTPVPNNKRTRKSNSLSEEIFRLRSEKIKRSAEMQLRLLDESNPHSPTSLDNVDEKNLTCESYDSHPNANLELDLAESIFEEMEKKRQRCLETEKTIRDIDAAMSRSTSPEDGDPRAYFQFLNHCRDYHVYLTENKPVIQVAARIVQRHSGVGILPRTPAKSKREVKTATRRSGASSSKPKVPSLVVSFRHRSPHGLNSTYTFKAPKLAESAKKQKSENLHVKKPTVKASPLPSVSQPVKRGAPTVTKSTGATSKTKSALLKAPSAKSTPCTTPRRPTSSKLSTKDNQKPILSVKPLTSKPSSALRSTKTPTPLVNTVPTVAITPATPTVSKSACPSSGKISQPVSNSQARTRKFFVTPGNSDEKVPLYKKRERFFKTPVKPNESSPSTTIRPKKISTKFGEYYGYSNIKSPVAAYINSTDTKLAQNVRAKKNEFLLTPTKQTTASMSSVETLRIKLSSANRLQQKKDQKSENNENIPDGSALAAIPKVVYQLPSKVCDINAGSAKRPGGQKKILQEINEQRLVVRHEGRVDEKSVETSIHISQPAEKIKTRLKTPAQTRKWK